MDRFASQTQIARAIVIFGIAILPFVPQPFRAEMFESQRAGMVGLLAVVMLLLALPKGRRLTREQRWLLAAIGLWVVALVVSTALSLSPTRSLMGELTRRLGLLTQLAMMGALMVSIVANGGLSRWVWLGGSATAAVTLLDAAANYVIPTAVGRPPGPFGLATLTGGWLALLLLWNLALWTHPPIRQRTLYLAGVALMAAALAITASRGALVGAGIGGLTLALIAAMRWKITRRMVRDGVFLLVVTLSVIAVYTAQFAPLPLARFFDLGALDFRDAMWNRTTVLTQQWSRMVAIDGTIDPQQALRPLVGYGPEMLEVVFHTVLDTSIGGIIPFQRIDRAHNDWLEVLVTGGWLGVGVRLLLWLAVLWAALKRLGIRGSPVWLLVPLGCALVFGLAVALHTPHFAPLTGTLGGIVGVWLLLTRLPVTSQPRDVRGLIVLAVAIGQLVDLQFGFSTVATGWPFWLAVGLLLAPDEAAQPDTDRPEITVWAWAALAGMWLLRFQIASDKPLLLIVASSAIFIILAFLTGRRLRGDWPVLIGAWAFGILGSQAGGLLAGLWDVTALGISLMLLTGLKLGSIPTTLLRNASSVLILALVAFFWWSDISADVAFQNSFVRAQTSLQLVQAQQAVERRPWDETLLRNLGVMQSVASFELSDTPQLLLAQARTTLQRATRLQPYDGATALHLAVLEANIALLEDDAAPHLAAADSYFAAASRLWPLDAGVWREWGRFLLDVANEPDRAASLLRYTLLLDDGDARAKDLLQQALEYGQ